MIMEAQAAAAGGPAGRLQLGAAGDEGGEDLCLQLDQPIGLAGRTAGKAGGVGQTG